MSAPKTLDMVLLDIATDEDAATPLSLITRSEEFLQEFSRRTGISMEWLRELDESGELEKMFSLQFYALSMQAMSQLAEAMSNGEVPTELLPKIAVETARMGHKLSGREVQKHLVLSADLWEQAAREALDRLGLEGQEKGKEDE